VRVIYLFIMKMIRKVRW